MRKYFKAAGLLSEFESMLPYFAEEITRRGGSHYKMSAAPGGN